MARAPTNRRAQRCERRPEREGCLEDERDRGGHQRAFDENLRVPPPWLRFVSQGETAQRGDGRRGHKNMQQMKPESGPREGQRMVSWPLAGEGILIRPKPLSRRRSGPFARRTATQRLDASSAGAGDRGLFQETPGEMSGQLPSVHATFSGTPRRDQSAG